MNPFKKILHDEKLPDTLKDKVMGDIELIKLSLDFTDLIAVKYPATLQELFTIKDKNKPDPNKKQS
ncbi:hypothetical protein GGR32_001525 [Mesonia hippocampi]|uniref:Uncharacterized protein n=1 Tax=Mesonia hippocampi TaxID=1628250 RepID=A0A840ELI6_9FLAO|nr:hypothetical protein [Mesonia hippocampi]MBB4119229.1 hypothetical protein [Mesonia hippocampi]